VSGEHRLAAEEGVCSLLFFSLAAGRLALRRSVRTTGGKGNSPTLANDGREFPDRKRRSWWVVPLRRRNAEQPEFTRIAGEPPMTYAIHLTRRAIQHLQKLQKKEQDRVGETLERLRRGDLRTTIKLSGAPKRWRMRLGDLRIVWEVQQSRGENASGLRGSGGRPVWEVQQSRGENAICVVYIGPRNERTYEAAGGRSSSDSKDAPLTLNGPDCEQDEPDEEQEGSPTPLEKQPRHKWDPISWNSFYHFIYGGYHSCPILTAEQETIFAGLFRDAAPRDRGSLWWVQSPPGTGKTVCAAQWACRLQQQGWHAILLVPPELEEQLRTYPDVREASERAGSAQRIVATRSLTDGGTEASPKEDAGAGSFWMGTFPQWLAAIGSHVAGRLADPDEELQALRGAALRAQLPPAEREALTARDATLYQAFVLGKPKLKDVCYRDDLPRVDRLKAIGVNLWERAWTEKSLKGRLCRHAAARELKEHPPDLPAGARQIVLFVDEAQEYLLIQLEALIAVKDAWERKVRTELVLLGDLNQRIEPTGFYWDSLLEADDKHTQLELVRNYRNSSKVLTLAKRIWDLAQKHTEEVKGRSLPPPAEPVHAFEEGEPI